MMRFVVFAALIATPAAAQPALTDVVVRQFVAGQEQAWNAGRLDAYFAGFTPGARFTDQAYVGDKPPVPYGTSTLAEARTQARKAAKAKPHETGQVRAVTLAADRRSAKVTSTVFATLGPRRLCASRVQTVVATPAGPRSTGLVDTYVKCRAP